MTSVLDYFCAMRLRFMPMRDTQAFPGGCTAAVIFGGRVLGYAQIWCRAQGVCGTLPGLAPGFFMPKMDVFNAWMIEVARPIPEWFKLTEATTSETMKRIADAVASNNMALQVKSAPMLAHWFMLDSLLLANQANRDGMHANALALTRQCIEAVGVIELGICGHANAEAVLAQWDEDRITPGKLRAWLQDNVWKNYGNGLWNEPWAVFMREFAAAIQPYAHYGRNLAQWQLRLHRVHDAEKPGEVLTAIIEMRPRAYDAQKATRITLYHALLTYVLGRVWIAANPTDSGFSAMITSLGTALGTSRYLDGHSRDWGQQFWAMLWERNGGTVLE